MSIAGSEPKVHTARARGYKQVALRGQIAGAAESPDRPELDISGWRQGLLGLSRELVCAHGSR